MKLKCSDELWNWDVCSLARFVGRSFVVVSAELESVSERVLPIPLPTHNYLSFWLACGTMTNKDTLSVNSLWGRSLPRSLTLSD